MHKFYTDCMLGKLARFLRFFGYDTLYRFNETEKEMLIQSLSENRIILSRSKSLLAKSKKLGVKALNIGNEGIINNLKILKQELEIGYPTDPGFSRCSNCNGILEEKAKDKIISRIPEGTAKYYNEFWECTNCKKIYWVGRHWENIKAILENVKT